MIGNFAVIAVHEDVVDLVVEVLRLELLEIRADLFLLGTLQEFALFACRAESSSVLLGFGAHQVAPVSPTGRSVLSDIDDNDRLTDKSSRGEL